MGREQLPQVLLLELLGHPEATARIEHLLRQEETVVAVEVAGGPRGLGHHMERTRGMPHRQDRSGCAVKGGHYGITWASQCLKCSLAVPQSAPTGTWPMVLPSRGSESDEVHHRCTPGASPESAEDTKMTMARRLGSSLTQAGKDVRDGRSSWNSQTVRSGSWLPNAKRAIAPPMTPTSPQTMNA